MIQGKFDGGIPGGETSRPKDTMLDPKIPCFVAYISHIYYFFSVFLNKDKIPYFIQNKFQHVLKLTMLQIIKLRFFLPVKIGTDCVIFIIDTSKFLSMKA